VKLVILQERLWQHWIL